MYFVEIYIIHYNNFLINAIIASRNQEFANKIGIFYKKLDISARLRGFWGPQITPIWGIIIKCDEFSHNINIFFTHFSGLFLCGFLSLLFPLKTARKKKLKT